MNIEETIDQLAERYELDQVKDIIKSAREQAQGNTIDVAVLGQFKAGKSSLINSLIGKDILPTGVIPVTAIITRVFYSPTESITIKFLDNTQKEINLQELKQYITETENPQNKKNVESAEIGLPQMQWLNGIRLIDTPGLGSIFDNNTETTQRWSAQTTIALIVISTERPLSEQDRKLLDEIKKFSYKTYCILTKADLFSDKQLTEITQFVSQSLKTILKAQIPVLHYSIKKDTEKHKQHIYQIIFEPLLTNTSAQINKIYNYKLLRSALLLQNYLRIAHQASVKTQQEQRELKEKIFNSQTSANFLYQQVQLIASDLKTQVRHKLEQVLLPHKQQIIKNIQDNFVKEYKTWNGNLYQISRKYESWLKDNLQEQIKITVERYRPQMLDIVQDSAQRLSFFTETFTENIKKKILSSLGIEIKTIKWQAQLRPFHTPDISVYRAFDSNIDLLWFLFPMFIFKNTFGKQFLKQIPQEVKKNLYRTISLLTGIINQEIEQLAQQAIGYINQYIDTISKALSIQGEKIAQLESDLDTLSHITNQIATNAENA